MHKDARRAADFLFHCHHRRTILLPVLTAAATSQFALTVMALTGTLVHIATGVFDRGVRRTIVLALGVLVGTQLGAYSARRVQGPWVMRL
jgi:uncharacterized membrane protein YfcA